MCRSVTCPNIWKACSGRSLSLAFGQEVKARLLQDLAQGFLVEAEGSPIAALDDPRVQLRGDAGDVRVGRGRSGRERCRGPPHTTGPTIAVPAPTMMISKALTVSMSPLLFSFPRTLPARRSTFRRPNTSVSRTARPVLPCRGLIMRSLPRGGISDLLHRSPSRARKPTGPSSSTGAVLPSSWTVCAPSASRPAADLFLGSTQPFLRPASPL
jgi:hypothetical protein